MKTTTNETANANRYMARATTTDGQLLMSSGRRGTVRVSREHAWSDIQAWKNNPRVKSITVDVASEIVWSWAR